MTPASAFLNLYPPFDACEPEALAFLDSRLRLEHFAPGSILAGPDAGLPVALFIVARGKVFATEAGSVAGEHDLGLSVGECFPIGALSGKRPPANTYAAATEVEAWLLPADDFHELLNLSPVFAKHCSSYLSSLVSESRKQMQALYSAQASEQQSLNRRLGELIKRAPIFVGANASIMQAVDKMGEHMAGSVVVVDGDGMPIGLLTQSDVVHRVVRGKVALERPIVDVMSKAPATLPDTAIAYEAIFAMASRGIRHLLLTDAAGRLSGVISERDLFALQRVGVGHVRRGIESADSVAALQSVLRDVQQSAFNMLAQGVGAEQMTQYISALNDAATQRVIELNLARHALHDIEWAWLAFGSEGREEQTLATDQDNGIVFLAADETERERRRPRLLAFARDVNRDLDTCGFTLCKGNIMAGNPEWCLSLDEWRARFSDWIENPHPAALLNATIFFDLRALHGRLELAERMQQHLFALSRANGAFLRMLAANALSVSPPLGLIRDFVAETDEHGKAFIDLKKFGARLFVDAARVLALANGIDVASTLTRLRRTANVKGGVGSAAEALIDAFNFIQLLRLRHQHQETGQGRPGDNRIFIGRLNTLDRRILKEAFRQAKALQLKLKVNYQL